MTPLADNCSGLSDCSFEVEIAVAIVAIVLVAALFLMLGPTLGLAVSRAYAIARAGGLRSYARALWRSEAGAPEAVTMPPHVLGRWGEIRLAQVLRWAGKKPTDSMPTSIGRRIHDRLVGGVEHTVAHEAKAGLRVRLTSDNARQIDKTAELIAKGRLKGAHWHFFQGAEDDILEYLISKRIPYTIH